MINVCEYCGKEFESENKRKYCSGKCKSAHYRIKNSKEVLCKECGKPFIAKYNNKGGYSEFCSKTCSSKYMHKHLSIKTLTCTKCGDEFEFKGTTNALYCPKCRKEVTKFLYIKSDVKTGRTKIGYIGKGNNNGKGVTHNSYKSGIGLYRQIRTDYLKENNIPIVCEVCGSDKNLEVHHIDENRQNNNVENLILLCKSCHKKKHIKRDELGKFISSKNN